MGEHTGAFSSLAGFREDPVVLGTIGCLIVLGGLGFFVWEDCLEHRSWRRLSFYSRMVLAVTGALILGDRMSGKEYLGCVLMLAAVVLAQLPDFRKKQAVPAPEN